MAVFNSKDRVGKYTVCNIIKSNLYTETYKVVDIEDSPFFLKLFLLNRLPQRLVNESTGSVKEIEYCRRLKHRNLAGYIEDGVVDREDGSYAYYVTPYFNGSILSDAIIQDGVLNEEDATRVFRGILEGLSYLHSQSPALCHNDLDPSNVMLSASTKEPVLIDLGHLSERTIGNVWFDTSDLNPIYHANETKMGVFDEQGDLFSACAVLYFMLSGNSPWNMELPEDKSYNEKFKELWGVRKTTPLNIESMPVSAKMKYVLSHGLALKASERFSSIADLLTVLDKEEIEDEDKPLREQAVPSHPKSDAEHEESESESSDSRSEDMEIKKGGGNGFKDIAGMQELKNYLHQKVIFVIREKEAAAKYRLKAPNGLLLYGPPGCGKTYVAEKFAEETGFNFMLIKSSDLGSSLIHGSQEKIKKLFKKAEKNAPIVLCFDEFDALVPDRGAHGNEYVASEVNEFLSQMNNCSERGIFVVATSNRPDKIDPAILRTGRIDKQVYVPLPDFEARKEMFRMYLENRPVEGQMDLDSYAKETEGYIASDIAYIVNDAAMTAAFARVPITASLIHSSISNIRPSLRKDSLEEYERIKDKMESLDRNNTRVRVAGL